MKVENTALPLSQIMIDTISDITTVTLWDGTYTETTRKNIFDTDAEQKEYKYEIYQVQVTNRQGLRESVENNFDVWYQAAKTKENDEIIKKETLELEHELEQNLVDMLLDYDFRLMMIEEGAI